MSKSDSLNSNKIIFTVCTVYCVLIQSAFFIGYRFLWEADGFSFVFIVVLSIIPLLNALLIVERIRGVLKQIEFWIFVGSYALNVYLCAKSNFNTLFPFILWVLVLLIYTFKNEKYEVFQELIYEDIFVFSISTQIQHILLLFVLYFTTITSFSITLMLLTFGLNTYMRMLMCKFDREKRDNGKGIIKGVVVEAILLIALAIILPYGAPIDKEPKVTIYIDRLGLIMMLVLFEIPFSTLWKKTLEYKKKTK